jgi:hypothetical protein
MKPVRLIAATALAIMAAGGVASAQDMPEGRVYAFHSSRQAGCPALDWHVVVGANGALSGMIAWDNMKAMAKATGTVNMQTRTFEITAKEVDGQGRTATVTGSVSQDGWLVANIHGPKVNCQGINVPWFSAPPPR